MSDSLFDMRPEGVVSFDQFWAVYPPRGRVPRRTNKQDARLEFAKVPLVDHPAMMDGLERQKRGRDWLETRYIPHASRWIKKRRWEDEEVELPFTPKENTMLREWRRRVALDGSCPHPDPECTTREDCDERQLAVWTKRGDL